MIEYGFLVGSFGSPFLICGVQVHTLRSFTTFLRRVLALNLPEAIWVTAELGQVSHSRGHTYLTLVEKEAGGDQLIAQVEAVLWAGQLNRIKREHGRKIEDLLQTGFEVKLRVTAQLHDRFGFKLIIQDIDPVHTMGKLELQRQATLERLREAGLLDQNARLELPPNVQRLAVVSSETAAGYADFRQQLAENPYGYAYETELFSTSMQGEQAPKEIIAALKRIERRRRYFDAVIIIRGGGARMDLIAFDDENVCRQVAAASLPVLSGIGHETDEVILDHLVHTALKTPTAVAAFLIDRSSRLESVVIQYAHRIGQYARAELTTAGHHLDRIVNGTQLSRNQLLQNEELKLLATQRNLPVMVTTAIKSEETRLEHLAALLEAHDPARILAKGYALLSQRGEIIRSVNEIEKGSSVKAKLNDGEVTLSVRSTKEAG
ncbi:exodeoxyribonuclease VII large subunit [Lewinellaceae bacterium SD302]|nr:exodeoxyribonuclease VII large subunit [Lewinellaceae bacterium SD302]